MRLAGAVLADQTDERAEGRRYLGPEIPARCWLTAVDTRGKVNPDTELALALALA